MNTPWRVKAARDLCKQLESAGLAWIEPQQVARGFGLHPKAVWDALVSERVMVGELVEVCKAMLQVLQEGDEFQGEVLEVMARAEESVEKAESRRALAEGGE